MRRLLFAVLVLVALIVLATLLLAIPAGAAEPAQPAGDESDWASLSELAAGSRIEVKTRDGKTHKGNLLAWSEEAISLREAKVEVGYRREAVVRILLVGPPNRRRTALKGFLIGLAPGALLGGVAAGVSAEAETTRGEIAGAVMGTAAIVGGIGAGIGALVARPAKTLVYRAPQVVSPTAAPLPPVAASSTPGALPEPLREAYRVFNLEQAARELARAANRKSKEEVR